MIKTTNHKKSLIYSVAIATIGILILYLLIWASFVKSNDPFKGITPDLGDSLHESGRAATSHGSKMQLGNTHFYAVAGPWKYDEPPDQDWMAYSISVMRQQDGVYRVFFEREFWISELTEDIVDRDVQQIASYDARSRTVTFDLGSRSEQYKLPRR